MSFSQLLPVANEVLKQYSRLAGPFAALDTLQGQTWTLAVTGLAEFSLRFERDRVVLLAADGDHDGRLHGSIHDLIALMQADDPMQCLAERDIEIQGSTRQLFALQALARQMLPDPGYLLGQKLGDVPAGIIMFWLEFIGKSSQRLAKLLAFRVSHFWKHERQLFMNAFPLNKVAGELALLQRMFGR